MLVAVTACGGVAPQGGRDPEPSLTTTPPMFAPTTAPIATGGSDNTRLIVLPDDDGRLPGDVIIGCPGGPSFPAAALETIRPLTGAGFDDVEAVISIFLAGEEGQYWPQQDWQILHSTEREVLVVTQSGGIWFQTVELVDGLWKWTGGGGGGPCPLQTAIPGGLNAVEWRLDPASAPLAPDTTRFDVIVNERECASGQAMGDRLLGPEIVLTEENAYLAFAAIPPPGDAQACPSNPDQAVSVELPEPLGDRVVLDGRSVLGDLEDYIPSG